MKEKKGMEDLTKDKLRAIRRARGGRQYSDKYAGPHDVKKKARIDKIRADELDEEIDLKEGIQNPVGVDACPVTMQPHKWSPKPPYECLNCNEIDMHEHGNEETESIEESMGKDAEEDLLEQ